MNGLVFLNLGSQQALTSPSEPAYQADEAQKTELI